MRWAHSIEHQECKYCVGRQGVRIRNYEFSLLTLNSQLPIPNSQLYIINVLLLSNIAFSWGISILSLKAQIFLTFLPESFGDTEKSYTYASAFENERYLKLNEKRKSLKKAVKKEFFEKIYIRQIK